MRTPITAATVCALALAAEAQTYQYAINQPASTLNYNLTFSAPFQTSPAGSSYIVGTAAGPDAVIGTADDTASPPGSRTIPGLFGGNTAVNSVINLSSGSISATGSSAAPYNPSGSFRVNFNPAASACTVTGLTSSLLGGGSASLAANASIAYPSFRTREPSCTIISIGPISIPVGNITATSITAAQTADAPGTMSPVPGQPGRYTFSAPVSALVTVTATLSGAPAPIDPVTVQLNVTGTVDLTQPSAPVTGQIAVNQSQTEPGPFTLDPLSFNEPLCNGPLLVKLALASATTTIGVNADLQAAGTLVSCGPADIGRQGGQPGADGLLNNNDFIVFIDFFFASNPQADRGRQGGVAGSDGLFNNNDFIVFIDQFFAGC